MTETTTMPQQEEQEQAATAAITFSVPVFRDMITATLQSVSTDMMLPVFQAIHIEVTRTGTTFTATNRHVLTMAEHHRLADETQMFTALLRASDAKGILHMIPKRANHEQVSLNLDADGRIVVAVDSESSQTLAQVDGQFPKIRHLVENRVAGPVESIRLDPAYLAPLARMPRDKNTGLAFTFGGDGKPVLIEWEHSDVEYRHLIMPMR